MVNGSAKIYKPSNIRRMERRKALMEESEAKRSKEEEYGKAQVSNPPINEFGHKTKAQSNRGQEWLMAETVRPRGV